MIVAERSDLVALLHRGLFCTYEGLGSFISGLFFLITYKAQHPCSRCFTRQSEAHTHRPKEALFNFDINSAVPYKYLSEW